MARKIIAGNWKMNLQLQEGLDLIRSVTKYLHNHPVSHLEVVLAPPYIHLASGQEILKDSPVSLAGQDCSQHSEGAYTGEVSAAMLASAGAELVILGHSERRLHFQESDETLRSKIKMAWKENLLPIFCVGENEVQRDAASQEEVVRRQIEGVCGDFNADTMENMVIAYEPVWAIGTGRTATALEVRQMHQFIRQHLRANYGATLADEVSILYGGSLKPANAREILSQPDVDGGLIGGASLNTVDFQELIATGEEVLR